jgi:DNA-binding CsgD family transcriptional regulator/GTP-binding protein EngB required for normal cell division
MCKVKAEDDGTVFQGAPSSARDASPCPTRQDTITNREQQILEMIWAGFRNKEIGERLKISTKTVEAHRASMMKKLCVSNASQLLKTALQAGLIKSSERSNDMSISESSSQSVVGWFRKFVRPIFERTESGPILQELDKLASQTEDLDRNEERLFPICLLGQAGVGKSTLINTLIADSNIVVPSGGGTGPLTANALRVMHGERPTFSVKYHSPKQVGQTRFILEAEIQRQTKGEEWLADAGSDDSSDSVTIGLDAEEQKKTRTEEAVGRACLLVAGAQTAHRELPYLADALRWVLGQSLKFHTQIRAEDMERLSQVKEALKYGMNETTRDFDSAVNSDFGHRLRDHACGFLAPLISEMSIQWPSPILRNSLELIDLPGIGVLSDAYASVTSDYLRNRAKAVMLVADSRGIRREDAELLRNSGFLNRLLHASHDLSADPVELIVAVVKIDDVAVENWRNDKAVNGAPLKSKAQHFAEQIERCKTDIAQRLNAFLREVWEDDTDGKRVVIQSILDNLKVFPVSAPQYRLLCSNDLDEGTPFLPNVEATNIVALREAISLVAQRCLAERNRRSEEIRQRFFGQLRARLEVLSAQSSEERQAEEEINKFKQNLADFMASLQREFDTRRGEFRSFLRKTIPTKIEAKVETASNKARKDINNLLKYLSNAHWKTLQAAVRKEGTFYGSRHINLPHDFALRFEAPVAEVWSREILIDIRRETGNFSEYESGVVSQVLDWAKGQGLRVSTRLLEALVEAVKQRRQQVNAVGKDAVEELSNKVREELIKKLEGPIRRKCQKFVAEQKDFGTGVKMRILELFEQLADEVVAAAAEPTITLLVERFKEVDKEILAAFGEHSEPLVEAADALIKRQEKKFQAEGDRLEEAIELALARMPCMP